MRPTARAPHDAPRPQPLTPEASAALAAASAALAAFNEQPGSLEPATPSPASGPRKLIDVFPPAAPAASAQEPTSAPAPARPASYERFYGLSEHPFDLSPDPRFLFEWEARDKVLRDLTAALKRHDGTILLTGETGAGKTTVCRALVAQLGRRTLVSFVGEPVAAARDLLETVLVDFGVISRADAVTGRLRGASRDDLASTLRDFIASLTALQAVALIIIDDAHRLTAGVLGDLQVLAELAREHKLLQVLLVGEPHLKASLATAELHQWDRLAGLRVELGPLASGDMADYVAHRLAVAGSTENPFDGDALARVHALSLGAPRTVNRLCDCALTMGQQASARSIDAGLVDRAARDLGLLSDRAAVASWRGRLMMVIVMLALMLAGAAGAGWMFREPLLRALSRWHVGF